MNIMELLDNHINFINGVFGSIKNPLFYLMEKINVLLLNDGEKQFRTTSMINLIFSAFRIYCRFRRRHSCSCWNRV